MKFASLVRTSAIAFCTTFALCATASSAPVSAPSPFLTAPSDNLVQVAVHCGPRAHYVPRHVIRRGNKRIVIKGRCVANGPPHH